MEAKLTDSSLWPQSLLLAGYITKAESTEALFRLFAGAKGYGEIVIFAGLLAIRTVFG